jgi:hypothetical protein
MGLQVMCRMHSELDCLAFARAYDAASPWSAVRPPMLDERVASFWRGEA